MQNEEKVIAIGVGGLIIRKGTLIVKHCNVSTDELIAFDMKDYSSDVLKFMTVAEGKLPRNTNLTPNLFPMISGINVFREAAIGEMFPDAFWNTYISNKIIYRDTTRRQYQPYQGNNLIDFAQWVEKERRFSAAIINITQRDGGSTLSNYLPMLIESEPTQLSKRLTTIINTIRSICNELKNAQVVHGDLHLNNILIHIDPIGKLHISLIDFGWSSALAFKLCDVERAKTITNLEDDSDFKNFAFCLQQHTSDRLNWVIKDILNNLEQII
jgi:serine/threonine protein kinase